MRVGVRVGAFANSIGAAASALCNIRGLLRAFSLNHFFSSNFILSLNVFLYVVRSVSRLYERFSLPRCRCNCMRFAMSYCCNTSNGVSPVCTSAYHAYVPVVFLCRFAMTCLLQLAHFMGNFVKLKGFFVVTIGMWKKWMDRHQYLPLSMDRLACRSFYVGKWAGADEIVERAVYAEGQEYGLMSFRRIRGPLSRESIAQC